MAYIAPVPITHSTVAGNVPDTSVESAIGALSVNLADGVIYTKDYFGAIVRIEGDSGNGSVASAATVNLGAIMGGVVDVTGTTTITAIALRVGQTRTVRFAGVLTLTHSANLYLPGQANIVTAVGDFATFRGFTGGVVRCTNYSFVGLTAFPSGTAALPSIAPRGDPNTGIWFPLADTIGLSTAGVERLRINATGDIAMAPAKKFYLDNGGDTYLIESSANVVDLYVGGVKALSITAAGLQSPSLVTPALGTPSALVGTNISGTGASFTAGDAQKLGGVAASSYSQTSHTHASYVVGPASGLSVSYASSAGSAGSAGFATQAGSLSAGVGVTGTKTGITSLTVSNGLITAWLP